MKLWLSDFWKIKSICWKIKIIYRVVILRIKTKWKYDGSDGNGDSDDEYNDGDGDDERKGQKDW